MKQIKSFTLSPETIEYIKEKAAIAQRKESDFLDKFIQHKMKEENYHADRNEQDPRSIED